MGVGGAGGNAINSMIQAGDIEEVTYIVANTDAQALNLSQASEKIQLGSKITKGLGAGSNPEVGRRAAEESIEDIINAITDADILFLAAGLGGGTGSGALPVIAAAAKEQGILTVAIITKPFLFEGKRRLSYAEHAVEQLCSVVDTYIVVPNQKLLAVADPKVSMMDAFTLSNNVLHQAIKGISDIIIKTGLINVDFADVRAVMKDMGRAIMGTAQCKGEDRAAKAALSAINSPLLENINIGGASGILINITGNSDLGLHEINDAAQVVYDMVREDANIILGSVIDPSINDEVMVTVIATGFNEKKEDTAFGLAEESNDDLLKVKKKPVVVEQSSYDMLMEDSSKEESVVIKEAKRDDFYDIDTPTFLRKKMESNQKS
ncbi:cell division protein FtsZ [Candidatus Dependentiae bacterium]|nr:MAG: cell division protein FtsZ [Candidatus Dependentiae bacterium]